EPIQADLVNAGQGFGQPAHTDAQSDRGQSQTEQAAGDTQYQAFQNCLSQQNGGAGAKSEAHGDFAAAADGTDQQQSGQVGAGDQQHDQDREKQNPHQLTSLLDGFLVQRTHHRADVQTRHE